MKALESSPAISLAGGAGNGGQTLGGYAPGPWASVAVEGGTLHVLAPGWLYDAGMRRAAPLTR